MRRGRGMCRGNIGKWQPSPRRVNKDTEDHSSGSRQRSGDAILARLERLGHHGCVRLSLERQKDKQRRRRHTPEDGPHFFCTSVTIAASLCDWGISISSTDGLQKKIEPPKASGGRYQKHQYSPTECWCCWGTDVSPAERWGASPAGRQKRTDTTDCARGRGASQVNYNL
jgi:hypothetical protein